MKHKTNAGPWTDAENSALLTVVYFPMLDHVTAGTPYNKAKIIREAIAGPLAARTRSSIECKLMNASAAHASLVPNAATMDTHGYRAMPNYQKTLKDAMLRVISRRSIDHNNQCRAVV